jgi:rhamnogalacturonan endolyase
MLFTNSTNPPSPSLDTSFFSGLSIQGYVPSSARGTTSGFATGVAQGFQPVLHWYNNASQYWVIASTNGSYTSPRMKPGAYTLTLYRNEFPIATSSVTITAGSNTPKNITSTEPNPSVVWRIGSFDGQPLELKNGDKIERMHPEDVRMGPWGGNYTVGKSTARDFPMALFAKQGGTATVNFEMSAEQAATETTLRVGTTLSFKGGRPRVEVRSWAGRDPGAPKLIDSRGVTRGAYRGYGEVYAWKIPAGTMKEGWNTLTMGVFGSGDAKFLSANYIVDAVELQGPAGRDSPR